MDYNGYTQRLADNDVIIFLFHGVIDENPYSVRNYNRKHILKHEFITLLKQLKHLGNPIHMDELVWAQHTKGDLPPKAFIISFDDGFQNNHSIAAPILDDLKIPATFYITSGFVEHNWMSWIDRIDYAIEHTQVKKLHPSFFDTQLEIDSIPKKIEFLETIRKLAKGDKDFFSNKEKIIEEIFELCNVKEVSSYSSIIDSKMTWAEVSSLSSSSNFTVGGHTHTHPIMSYLTGDQLNAEIDQCLNHLKTAVNQPIEHFSYPEGLTHCFNEKVIDTLKKKGIRCCPTAIDGENNVNTDLFYLKRVTVV